MAIEQTPAFPGTGNQITPPLYKPVSEPSKVPTDKHAVPKAAETMAATARPLPQGTPEAHKTMTPDAIRGELAFQEKLLAHPKLAKESVPTVRAKVAELRAALH